MGIQPVGCQIGCQILTREGSGSDFVLRRGFSLTASAMKAATVSKLCSTL